MKKFCTYHEYRFSLGLASLVGMMTGIVDASIDDWSVKAFIWSGILFFYSLIISYEFIVMPTPPKPLLQAFLFVSISPLGLLSAHHWTWYLLTVMLGKPIEFRLWLAPNIYVDLNLYNMIMMISLSVYITYLVIINLVSCEKRYEY
jgi:hypothetical protein